MHSKNLVLDLTFGNYSAILRSSVTPLTPLFFGPATPGSICKWRGFFSDVSYNSYLRNAYVKINSGLKSEAGIPLIEFSRWNTTSTIRLVLPKTLTYKVFKSNNSWKFGYLGRLSTVSGERWSLTLGPSDFNFLSFLPTVNLFTSTYEPLSRRTIYSLFGRFGELASSTDSIQFTQPVNFRNFSVLAAVQKCKSIQFFGEKSCLQASYFDYTQFSLFDLNKKAFYFSRTSMSEVPFFLDSLFRNLVFRHTRDASRRILPHNSLRDNFIKDLAISYTRSSFIFLIYTLLHLFLEQRKQSALRTYFNLVLAFTVRYFINACFACSVLDLSLLTRSWLLNNNSIHTLLASFIRIETQLASVRFTAISLTNCSPIFLRTFITSYFGIIIPEITLNLLTSIVLPRSYLMATTLVSNYVPALKALTLDYSNLTPLFSLKVLSNRLTSSVFLFEYLKIRNFRKKFYKKRKFKRYNPALVGQITNFIRKKKIRRVFFRKFKLGILRAQFSILFFWSFNFFNITAFKRSSSYFTLLAFSVSSFFVLFKRFVCFYGFVFGLFKSFYLNTLVSAQTSYVFQLKFYLWRLLFYFRLLLASFRRFIFKLVSLRRSKLTSDLRNSASIQSFGVNAKSLLSSLICFVQLALSPYNSVSSVTQITAIPASMFGVARGLRKPAPRKRNLNYNLRSKKNFFTSRRRHQYFLKRLITQRQTPSFSSQKYLVRRLFLDNWAAGFKGKRLLVATTLSVLSFFKTTSGTRAIPGVFNPDTNRVIKRLRALNKRFLKKSYFGSIPFHGKKAFACRILSSIRKVAQYIRFLLSLRKNYFLLVSRQFLSTFSLLLQRSLTLKKSKAFSELNFLSSSLFFWKFKFFEILFSRFSAGISLVARRITQLLVDKIINFYSWASLDVETPILLSVQAFIRKNIKSFLPSLETKSGRFFSKIILKKFVKRPLRKKLVLDHKTVLSHRVALRQFCFYGLKLARFSRLFFLRLSPVYNKLACLNRGVNKFFAIRLLSLTQAFFSLLKKFSVSRALIKQSELALSLHEPALNRIDYFRSYVKVRPRNSRKITASNQLGSNYISSKRALVKRNFYSLTCLGQLFVGRSFLKRIIRIFNKLRHRRTYLMEIAHAGRISDISSFSNARKLVMLFNSNTFLTTRPVLNKFPQLNMASFINNQLFNFRGLNEAGSAFLKRLKLTRKLFCSNCATIYLPNSAQPYPQRISFINHLIGRNDFFTQTFNSFYSCKPYLKLSRNTTKIKYFSKSSKYSGCTLFFSKSFGRRLSSTAVKRNWSYSAPAIPSLYVLPNRLPLYLESEFFLRLKRRQFKSSCISLLAKNFFVNRITSRLNPLDVQESKDSFFDFKFYGNVGDDYFSVKGKDDFNFSRVQNDLNFRATSYSSRKLSSTVSSQLTFCSRFIDSIVLIRVLLDSVVATDQPPLQIRSRLGYLGAILNERGVNLPSRLSNYYVSIFCLLPAVASSKCLASIRILQGLLLKRHYTSNHTSLLLQNSKIGVGYLSPKLPYAKYENSYIGLKSSYFDKCAALFRSLLPAESIYLLAKSKIFFRNFLVAFISNQRNSFLNMASRSVLFSFFRRGAIISPSALNAHFKTKIVSPESSWSQLAYMSPGFDFLYAAPCCILENGLFVKSALLSVYCARIGGGTNLKNFVKPVFISICYRGLFSSFCRGIFTNFNTKFLPLNTPKFLSILSVLTNNFFYFQTFKSFNKAGLRCIQLFLAQSINLLRNFSKQAFLFGKPTCNTKDSSFLFSSSLALRKSFNTRRSLLAKDPVSRGDNYIGAVSVDRSKTTLYCKIFSEFYFSLKQLLPNFFLSFSNSIKFNLSSFALCELSFNKYSRLSEVVLREASCIARSLKLLSGFSLFIRQILTNRFFFARSLFFGKLSSYIRLSISYLTYSVIRWRVGSFYPASKGLLSRIRHIYSARLDLKAFSLCNSTRSMHFTDTFRLCIRSTLLEFYRFTLPQPSSVLVLNAPTVKLSRAYGDFFRVPADLLQSKMFLCKDFNILKSNYLAHACSVDFTKFFNLHVYLSFAVMRANKTFLWHLYAPKAFFSSKLILGLISWRSNFFFRFSSFRCRSLLCRKPIFFNFFRKSRHFSLSPVNLSHILHKCATAQFTMLSYFSKLSSFSLRAKFLVDSSMKRRFFAQSYSSLRPSRVLLSTFTLLQSSVNSSSSVFYATAFFARITSLLGHIRIFKGNDLYNSSVLRIFYTKLRRTFRLRVYAIVRKLGLVKRRLSRLVWRRLKQLGFFKPLVNTVTSKERLSTSTYFGKMDFTARSFRKKGHFFIKNLRYNFVARRWGYDRFKRVINAMRLVRRLVFSTSKTIFPYFLNRKRRLRRDFKRRQYKFWGKVALLRRYLVNFNYLNVSTELTKRVKLNQNFFTRFINSADLNYSLAKSTSLNSNISLTLYLFRKRLLLAILRRFTASVQRFCISFFKRFKLFFIFYFMLYLFRSSHNFFLNYSSATAVLPHFLLTDNLSAVIVRFAYFKQFLLCSNNTVYTLQLLTHTVVFDSQDLTFFDFKRKLNPFYSTSNGGFELSWDILAIGGVVSFRHLVVGGTTFTLASTSALLFIDAATTFKYCLKRKLSGFGHFAWRFFLLRSNFDSGFVPLVGFKKIVCNSSKPSLTSDHKNFRFRTRKFLKTNFPKRF